MSKRDRLGKIKGLDVGIKGTVHLLRRKGVDTFSSCQGSPGHARSEPNVRFFGDGDEGPRALQIILSAFPEAKKQPQLRRIWDVVDGEPTGPYWELVWLPIGRIRASGIRRTAADDNRHTEGSSSRSSCHPSSPSGRGRPDLPLPQSCGTDSPSPEPLGLSGPSRDSSCFPRECGGPEPNPPQVAS